MHLGLIKNEDDEPRCNEMFSAKSDHIAKTIGFCPEMRKMPSTSTAILLLLLL
jgi:hypothetical protein